MTQSLELTKKKFDTLLNWLSPDRESAGVEYELIRTGLIRFFRFRGCENTEMLADETITRVATKLDQYDLSKKTPKLAFFHGFAKKLFLEYIERVKTDEFSEEKYRVFSANLSEAVEPENIEMVCLEKCLSKLKAADRKLIIAYYVGEKDGKIDNRKIFAKKLSISLRGLHTKAFRIRESLKNCISDCFNKKIVK